jgi:ubiquinone biosynthesis protein
MTLGWADGVAMGDNDAIDGAGHDRHALGERVLQLFLSHALRDGFFHADMHQGNLKVAPNGNIIAYDFGIMGHIDEYTRRVYAEILFGFIRKDYQRVAEVHFEAGYVPANRDVDEFARALRAVGEPIFGMDATRISMARLLSYLFEVTERFGMETRTELIHLQRTMVVVEGVARSMNPKMTIWEDARPIVEAYIKDSIGPKAIMQDLVKTAVVLSRYGSRLPAMAEAAIIRQSKPAQNDDQKLNLGPAVWMVSGAAIMGLAVWIASSI